MKIYDRIEQGTPAWLALRAGKITGTDAGAFCCDPRPVTMTTDQIKEELTRLAIPHLKSLAKPKLIALLPNGGAAYQQLSSAAKNLLIQKYVDGRPKDPFQLAQEAKEARQMANMIPIQRGNALEPAARAYYERKRGVTVTQVGFLESDCGTYGMSPDGIILPDGYALDLYEDGFYDGPTIERGLECKAPNPDTHARYLVEHHGKGTIPPEYFWQCHMGMAVTGAPVWDFLSFSTHDAPLLVPVHRDHNTEALVEGLNILRDERRILENFFADVWDAEYDVPGGELLLCYHNGRPMFTAEGMPLDDQGNLILAPSTGRES